MKIFWRWLATLVWAVLIWYLTTIPDFRPVNNSYLSMLFSSGGHFFFFGVLALLTPLSLATSLTTTTIYGLSIELVQRTIPGRSFSLFDLALDAFGAFVFVYSMRRYSQ